ncbi:MAG TPA: hypothetical protein VGI83_03960, partial [Gemmatimonadales bacterium]
NLSESLLTRAAHVVCTYSYGIYLLHQTALWLSFAVWKRAPLAAQWMMCVALLVALPALFYHFVERPGIQLGKRLVGKGPASSVPATERREGRLSASR